MRNRKNYCKEYYRKHRNEKLAHQKQWYETHRSEKLAYDKRWYETRRDEILAHKKQWRETHRNEILAHQKQYYKEHRDEILAYGRQWRESHREQNREFERRKNFKRRSLGFIPLNKPFEGSEAHHICATFVIYIPKDMHRSIYHSIWTGKNMDEINKLAWEWVKHEGET